MNRLLFSEKLANDVIRRRPIGYPAFTNTDASRRVHMARHQEEFGSEEPDIPLYASYPISTASFRRKLARDAAVRTGLRLLRVQLAGITSPVTVVRRTLMKILFMQSVLIATWILLSVWWLYPLF